jgi:hypothetical protein
MNKDNFFLSSLNPHYALELRYEGLNGNKISIFGIEP